MLTEEDKKWVKSAVVDGVVEALSELIFPQFDKIDQRFEKIDQRFEKIDQRFINLEERIGNLEVSNDNILRTVVRIEDHLDRNDAKLDNHEHRLLKLETVKV